MVLIRDVIVRWNSLYEAAKRFLELKEALVIFWTKYCTEFKFTDEDWILLEGLVEVLYPLYFVTVDLSASKHVSISKVIPLTNRLKEIYNGKAEAIIQRMPKIGSNIPRNV